MADLHDSLVTIILLLYHAYYYIRSSSPLKREAMLLVIHNFLMYFLINRFKQLAQNSINSTGPVNTFYYVPLVYEAPAKYNYEDIHLVLKTRIWTFMETLFRHHLALLLAFSLALLVPRCKLLYVSSLVILSNFTLCACFSYAIWHWLILNRFNFSLRLVPIFVLGPVLQLLLIFRFTVRMLMTELVEEEEQLTVIRQEPLPILQEFRLSNLELNYHSPQDFYRSQWQSERTSPCFFLYRWAMAIFFGTGFVCYLFDSYHRGYWGIYLTNWGFLMCCITTNFAAGLVTIYYVNPDAMLFHSDITKFYWALYHTNLIIAHVIAVMYWALIYPRDRTADNPLLNHYIYNLLVHAAPITLLNLDQMLVAQPVRLLHFVYPFGFSLLYVLFTYTYYLCGGVDPRGRHYIYRMLNYKKPLAALTTIGIFIGTLMACSVFQYGVYRFRVFIARKLGKLQ